MAQRQSGYARQPSDCYVTPQWVWDKLYQVEPWAVAAVDCAPVDYEIDFLDPEYNPPHAFDWYATNPPFSLATEFCRKAIMLSGRVAMLLPNEFDTAKGRIDLFSKPPFKIKYVLTERIRWANLKQKKNGPSSNHAWYVWDAEYTGRPMIWWL